MAEALDSSEFSLPPINGTIKLDVLPSWQRMESTVIIALDTALNCKEFIDRDELWLQIQQLYSKAPENFDEDDRSLLALLYALMAVGRQRDPDSPQLLQETMPRGIVVRGLSYFRTSRAILDSVDCTNLNSIMALCCLASYLLSSSMISKAYACICTAASAALRMGLHVSSSALRQKLSKAELSKRRRVFAILNIIDTIVSSVLGMPKILQHADADQIIPVPEEDLPDEGRSLVDEHPMSPVAETIISAKLFRILVSTLTFGDPGILSYKTCRVGSIKVDTHRPNVLQQRQAPMAWTIASLLASDSRSRNGTEACQRRYLTMPIKDRYGLRCFFAFSMLLQKYLYIDHFYIISTEKRTILHSIIKVIPLALRACALRPNWFTLSRVWTDKAFCMRRNGKRYQSKCFTSKMEQLIN